MAHIRTQIRERFRQTLSDRLPTNYRVFAGRVYKRVHNFDSPTVDMTFQNVNVDQETMSDERRCVASLYVRVQRSGPEDTLDDALDMDEVLIAQAVLSAEWGDLLTEDPELKQVNFAQDDSAQAAFGAIILRYDVEYRIDRNDPESARA